MRASTLAVMLSVGCAHTSGHHVLWAPTGPAVGLKAIAPTDVLTGKALAAFVFYPPVTVHPGGFTDFGPNRIEAELGLPIAEGKHPLVLISHGHLGSALGHHDLAEHLARAGYLVAAVKHSGDSYDDDSAVGSDRMMLGRPYQISATLDAVLADPMLGPHVDQSRIGVAGFSAGGYTSLLVVGAHPDFGLHAGYCQRHPDDREICSIKELKKTIADPRPTVDPRVKAAFVMAPLAIFFGPGTLDDVHAPVFLTWAEQDRTLLPDGNALLVQRGLKTLKGTHAIPNAEHYVFLAPCSAAMAEDAPMICDDPPGVDRGQIHRALNEEAKVFFDQQLAP